MTIQRPKVKPKPLFALLFSNMNTYGLYKNVITRCLQQQNVLELNNTLSRYLCRFFKGTRNSVAVCSTVKWSHARLRRVRAHRPRLFLCDNGTLHYRKWYCQRPMNRSTSSKSRFKLSPARQWHEHNLGNMAVYSIESHDFEQIYILIWNVIGTWRVLRDH